MIISLNTEEFSDVNIMRVDGQDFNSWAKIPGVKISDGGNFQTLTFQIGKVGFTLFYTKEKCVMCKNELQDDFSVDLCCSCFEELEEKEHQDRLQMKREDAYDASRGH